MRRPVVLERFANASEKKSTKYVLVLPVTFVTTVLLEFFMVVIYVPIYVVRSSSKVS